ncbi:MAG: oligosaccharide flippase family protein [Anaerolineae bacterium]|nr:oligosaccharide flippase family protein [Anaerolineae bacterium]MCB9105206.1 oligosaccharide flippase family protein [Anaerolineales bacterium]
MSVLAKKLQSGPLRNVSVISLHKSAQIVGQLVAVATIPRLLGAEDHGQFAFIISLAYLGQILGDFGTLEVMSRFVPTLPSGEKEQLYMRTLVFKVVVGLVCALLTVMAAMWLAPWMRLSWALLIGVGVVAHIVAWVPFQYMLGVNQIGQWMVEQSWRQWVLLLLLVALYPWLGMTGTVLAWTGMELVFCGLGLWWTRGYWQTAELRLVWAYLWPYITFGFGFFIANLVSALLYRSGPVLVETMTRETAQAGFLNLAIGLFLMPYLLLTQVAFSFVPTLSSFYTQGQLDQLQQWVSNFVRYSWLVGWVGVVGVWLTADWGVQFVFGPDYAEAAAPLKWISVGIPLSALLWGANIVATVAGQGKLRFWSSLAALFVFIVASLWLVPRYSATGAAIGLSLSVVANFAVLYYFLRSIYRPAWLLYLSTGVVGGVILWLLASLGF